jgi:hypothetical protein
VYCGESSVLVFNTVGALLKLKKKMNRAVSLTCDQHHLPGHDRCCCSCCCFSRLCQLLLTVCLYAYVGRCWILSQSEQHGFLLPASKVVE